MRSILLPTYLKDKKLWIDLCDAIDGTFNDTDWVTGQLRTIRDPYAVGPKIQQAIRAGTLYDTTSAEYQQDLQLLLQQVSFNGFPLSTPSFMTATHALLLFRNIGEFWYQKGTKKLLALLNFCLDASITMENLWTEDYVTFVAESLVLSAPLTYPPITTLGGTWYPTTHVSVDLGIAAVFASVPITDFLTFFNEAFNYNLVLHSVNSGLTLPFGGSIVAMGLYVEEHFFVPGA